MICVVRAGDGFQIMIKFQGSLSLPLEKFKVIFDNAVKHKQQNVEAICISTVSIDGIPSSRMVNIKYVEDNNLIFFSNFNSPKSIDLQNNNDISCVFFWHSINTQIRIIGKAKKINSKESDQHFKKRKKNKKALAISSNQSKKIDSYEDVIKKYQDVLRNNSCDQRPDYWGGFKIIPTYFEFWTGHDSRINKREVYELNDGNWSNFFLEP